MRKGVKCVDAVVFGMIQAVVMSMGIWYLQRKLAKRDDAAERREKEREDMEYNLLTAVNASIALGEATAKAVQRIPDAHCNGDMTAALNYTTTVKHDLKNFLNRKAVEKIV
ncbi:serine/threonine protein kinase [Anaerotignum propionicum]|uniref:serine/threonine protein kinase n=1 Tax=Anaerotignum propionicum TaxID=28446 RepID=UPI00210D4712|nr:serine/threonine protein kinase [Anaerotignum propionicum]MCQ4935046.1 serine/threonine protein kinase [Anaerotignum propionicum]